MGYHLLAPPSDSRSSGTQRISLEQGYFEINKDNVDLISMWENAIARFSEKRIATVGGEERDFDAICIVTGLDSIIRSHYAY
jgi:hypothetical protein